MSSPLSPTQPSPHNVNVARQLNLMHQKLGDNHEPTPRGHPSASATTTPHPVNPPDQNPTLPMATPGIINPLGPVTPVSEWEAYRTGAALYQSPAPIPVSPAHAPAQVQIREWAPSRSKGWSTPIDILQETPHPHLLSTPTNPPKKTFRSSSFYGPVPATPSRRAPSLTEPSSTEPDDDEEFPDSPLSPLPPPGVFTYDPLGSPPRTPLWTPAPALGPECGCGGPLLDDGWEFGFGFGVEVGGEGVYPSPPRTPERVSRVWCAR